VAAGRDRIIPISIPSTNPVKKSKDNTLSRIGGSGESGIFRKYILTRKIRHPEMGVD
jgi:hypothetical protein